MVSNSEIQLNIARFFVSLRKGNVLPLVLTILALILSGFVWKWFWGTSEPQFTLKTSLPNVTSETNGGDDIETTRPPKSQAPISSLTDGKMTTHLLRLAPLRLEMHLCGDFPEQLFQTVSSILVGVLLGAQVILPQTLADLDFDWLFDVGRLQFKAQKFYTKYWCTRRNRTAHRLWCSDTFFVPGILTPREMRSAATSRSIKTLDLEKLVKPKGSKASSKVSTFVDLPQVGEDIWQTSVPVNKEKEFVTINTEACDWYKHLRLIEPDPAYDLFWELYDALEFNKEILQLFTRLKMTLAFEPALKANDRATSLGYRAATEFQPVVLEVDRVGSSSSFDVGNTMLSEGVPPSQAVYLKRKTPHVGDGLSGTLESVYTLVTKDVINETKIHDATWAAVDLLMATAAGFYIGPSSSTFSSLMILARRRLGLEAFHYDGEISWLESKGILVPQRSTAVEVMRKPMKWLFVLGKRHKTSAAWNMSLAAVRSAVIADVVPVCLTDAEPTSWMVQLLVRTGARVLHHVPKWENEATALLNKWRSKKGSEKQWMFTFPKFADIKGSLMRIDIPIVGLLDRFVLYTDVDVIFQQQVDWETMIGKDSSVAYTAENLRYGEPGTVGLPEFFAMSGDKVNDLEKMDTGVMLMNLVTLRKTYSDFLRFLFDPTTWKYTSADPCGYKDYYKNKGQIAATLLPSTMNWKIWESSKNSDSSAVIVHYHGPKCETDIQPFLSEGSVRVDSFRPFLEPCSEKIPHQCSEYCKEYERFLFRAYEQAEWNPNL